MSHLKITITAKIPLPKNAAAAVSETLAQTYFAREACNALQRNQVWPEMHIEQIEADAAEPAPAPKRRGRKPRAALGSSPLASAAAVDGVSRPTALSPEAGADPGPLSELAAAALRQAGRS